VPDVQRLCVMEAVTLLPFHVAVITSVWVLLVAPALAVKVAEVAPEAMVTDAGIVSVEQPSVSPTAAPPLGAAFVRVTVHVALPLGDRLEGEHASAESFALTVGATTVSAAEAEDPFSDALTVTAWFVVTDPAAALNVAVVAPEATVTEAGTVRAEELSESATTAPPLGAAAESVTEQAELAPDATLEGEHWIAETVAWAAGGAPEPIAVFISF
jgi:hypothetical protein